MKNFEAHWLPSNAEKAMFEAWDDTFLAVQNKKRTGGVAPTTKNTALLHSENVITSLTKESVVRVVAGHGRFNCDLGEKGKSGILHSIKPVRPSSATPLIASPSTSPRNMHCGSIRSKSGSQSSSEKSSGAAIFSQPKISGPKSRPSSNTSTRQWQNRSDGPIKENLWWPTYRGLNLR